MQVNAPQVCMCVALSSLWVCHCKPWLSYCTCWFNLLLWNINCYEHVFYPHQYIPHNAAAQKWPCYAAVNSESLQNQMYFGCSIPIMVLSISMGTGHSAFVFITVQQCNGCGDFITAELCLTAQNVNNVARYNVYPKRDEWPACLKYDHDRCST